MMGAMTELHPAYAHEHPDRPLVQGTFLCCCLLCAVALERAGQEDAHRPVVFHTGWGIRTWQAESVAWHRAEETLHDMLAVRDMGSPGNWVKAVTVGPRRGRAARGCEPDGLYPRPLEDWPVCRHCGPLSTATFAQLVDFGAKPRRRSAKARAADEFSQLARARLVQRVEAVAIEQREAAARAWRGLWRQPLVVVPDFLPDDAEQW
jgi:hypothetical protein